ncbi:MAG: type II toxin-antitoxin system VapC family toxin [Acidobacteria bacterium]|nr:type II toxin-antitoxin system VapC family toxin [Acidobacteriota bacterium]
MIDANIFLYHFAGSSLECRNLLERAASQEVSGSFAITTALEVTHRLMWMEATQRGWIRGRNPARELRKVRHRIKELTLYAHLSQQMFCTGLKLLGLTEALLLRSEMYRREYGLLVQDALLPALMEEHAIPVLATADRDFRSVRGIEDYFPGDVKM